ncbi:class I SAM-dependent methyltransferase [Microlunatus speluncae]|uniref:class I SAM-dependent methyltransferase n=1 Tax=Microlunatus speluncae TaxID=2594267 RepID=UPI0012665BD7|nr:class I SAM-dependent methyltransferase [Microlunatus speluncae]
MATTQSQRDAFDESAPVYQSARPAYPSELFDELITLTKITPAAEILEIGAGPGLATVDLARRGFKITALEPGERLAEQARHNLAAHPAVSVITSGFEPWQSPAGATYDLVFAANAWQWVDRELRWAKAARLLTPGGHLAIFGAHHAFPDGFDPFFTEIHQVYVELGEAVGDWPPPPPRLVNGDLIDEGIASGHFRRVAQRMFVWPVRYTVDSYLALLDTFANHIVMEPAKRQQLYAEVRRLLAQRPDGQVTRHWISQLAVLQHVPGEAQK